MRVTFFSILIVLIVAVGTAAALWLRQAAPSTPEFVTIALWGLMLIGFSGGLRICFRGPRHALQGSFGESQVRTLDTAKRSAQAA